MLADFLGLYEEDDTDSSTDSEDEDEDEGMDMDGQPAPQVKLPVRSGLKIILPARKDVHVDAPDVVAHSAPDVHTHKTLDDGYDESDSSMDEEPTEGDDFMDLDADGDDDESEQELGYDAEDDEDDEDPKPVVSIIRRRVGRLRSPLSACGRYGTFPVYAAYHCKIHGCDFTASSAQHLRHHMSTASHSRQWRHGGHIVG